MSLTLLLVSLLVAKTIVIGLLLRIWQQGRTQQATLSVQLEASEAQYRQVMAVADLAMTVLDESCHVVDWNPALEKLYGRSRAEALGQQFFLNYAPPREGAALAARVMAMRATDEVFEFTFAIPQTGNAAPRQMCWRARHFTDARDNRRYLSMIGNDVTALESVLELLAGSDTRFRTMFESVPVALALIDSAGHLRMVNSECAAFFGFDAPEQMVALNVQELIHPDDQHASALALASLQTRAEKLYQMETCYLRRDGVARWGNARGVLVEMAPGESYFLAQISDVHERKQTERALMESERRLTTLIANLSGAVYRYELSSGNSVLHHDFSPEFLSDGVEALTGQSRAQFMHHDKPHVLGQLIFAEDRALVIKALSDAMAGDGRFQTIYRLHHGLAGMRWIAEHGLVWQRLDGSWTVDGHLTDITNERQAREAEQVYRALVADTHTGFLCLHASGRVLDVNEPFCSMLGLGTRDQVCGRALELVLAPGHADDVRQFMQRVLGEGGLHDVEFAYTRADGVRVYLLVNAVATQDGENRLVKCLLVDISRAKRAERARRESEIRYRSLFDTNINGICFISLDGHIEAANPALNRLLGHADTEHALLGRNLHEITAPASHELDATAREQIMMRGWCDSYRKELECANGQHVPVSIQAWLVRDADEVPQRIMCVVRDITEITRMETERDDLQRGLRQAQKMEAVGQLAGGIAHDFNNILASILGYAELATRRMPLDGDEKVATYLGEIHAAGTRARDLIRQLLLFSRAGRNDSRVQNITPLVQDTARMLRPTLPATLSLRTFVSQALPLVRVDAVGLQQVVMNLVINARDASDHHGEVKILARLADTQGLRCASCHALMTGHHVEIAVSDQGSGIAHGVLERIFDPFFTTKPVGQGTGMGLSVVHGVVHEMGGHVVVSSNRTGSTFRVLLPVEDEAPEVGVLPASVDAASGRGEVIMVVDDDPAVANMLGELLRAAGYEVLVFTDSTRAAMQLEDIATPIAALISDQVMPGLEGGELMHLARRYRPALPVILLSAQSELLPMSEGDPVLAKPVQSAELLQALRKNLQQSLWHADQPAPGTEFPDTEYLES